MEVFDAYDEKGNLLGFDLIRDEPIPEKIFHKVVGIFCFDHELKLLTTQRHPHKKWGLSWEITAGSVLKGEDELHAAQRELFEETGIQVKLEELIKVESHLEKDVIWITYLVILNKTPDIVYQDTETIDHVWMRLNEFETSLKTERFALPLRNRYPILKNPLTNILREKGHML
jgi:8-oxo-dGTP diphosphatase